MTSILRRLAPGAVFALVLASCDPDAKLCMPPETEDAQAATGSAARPSDEQPPDRFVLILDESYGMSGFRHLPDAAQSRDTEYGQMLGSLRDLDVNVPFESYALPGETPKNPQPTTPRKITNLADEIGPRTCKWVEDHCRNYLKNAFISSLIERARGNTLGVEHAHLAEGSHDLILLVTDLQPDVPPEAGSTPRYLNETFRPLIEKDHLAVGFLPVVSSFFGPVYDTGAISPVTHKPEAPVLGPEDRQPFFLIPIGQDGAVRWMLHQLKNIRDTKLHDSRSFDPVIFSSQVPEPEADPFLAQPPQTAEVGSGAMPPAAADFQRQTPMFLTLHRKQSHAGDIRIEYVPKRLSESSAVLPYELRVTDEHLQPAKVWVYYPGGPHAADACRQLWVHEPRADMFKASKTAADSEASPTEGPAPPGDVLAVTIGDADKQSLLVHAIYYVEETVNVAPHRLPARPPDWVARWSFEPGTSAADALAKRDARLGHVSIGVNSLTELFRGMQTQPPDRQKPVTLRFAMQVAED